MSIHDTLKVGDYTVHTGLFIDNEWVKGNGEAFATVNPATEEEIGKIQSANESDVNAAVTSARLAFETTWGLNTPGAERGRLLFALADKVVEAKEELAYLESVDCGKPISWAKADIDDTVACLRYYAGYADKILGQVVEVDDQSKHAVIRKEPIGVAALIVPWNYPILISCWKLGPALAAGCSVIFKMAETTPLSTLKLAELIKEVGYPKGAFNLLSGLGSVTGNIISHHMDIDKISFTGSTITGRKIAEAAAKSNLKAVTLELGGKSPNIVFEKADLRDAARWSAFGIFENMGQSCTAASRLLVQSSVYDEFVKYYLEAVAQIKVGDPLDPATFQGAQNNVNQYEKIMGMIESGKKSAKLLTGGSRHGDKGYFIQPTVFGDVTMDMEIGKEEIFGPVSSIIKFETEEEALKIANNTSYGLAAAIHSLDIRQVHRVSRKLKAGTVWVNQYTLLSHAVPFGGYKQSGWGRELGVQGLEAFLTVKAVHMYHGEPLDWPIEL